jgi:Putative DNA-binding domain
MHEIFAIQHEFAAAVFDLGSPLPMSLHAATGVRTDSGFAVYRNNFAESLIGAIAARYPTVVRLAGMDSFRTAAHNYVLSEPPRSPVLLQYGETFPHFLRDLRTSPSLDYLAEIAELDLARIKAYHAADATPVGREAFAELPRASLDRLRFLIHPSASVIASRFPIVTIWEASQSGNTGAILQQWGAQAALVARPFLDVEVRLLPPGGPAFFKSLSNGDTMALAAQVASAHTEDFELAANLALLIESNIVVGFCGTD